MRIQFASLVMEIAYNQDKSVIIRRFPTEFETTELNKSKYKLVDEEIYVSDNQIELNMFYNTRRKHVDVISGGNWDFKEGGRFGVDIDLKIKHSEKEFNDYLCDTIRKLCKKHLKLPILFSSRYTINCQIDKCRLSDEIVKKFLEDFVTTIEGKIEEHKVVRKEQKIEEGAEEKVKKIEEQEKCSDCGKDLKFLKIERWYDKGLDKTINLCSECWGIRVHDKAKKQLENINGKKNFGYLNCEKCGKKEPEKRMRSIYSSVLDRNVILCSSCYSFGNITLKEIENAEKGENSSKINENLLESKKISKKWKVVLIILTLLACGSIILLIKSLIGI